MWSPCGAQSIAGFVVQEGAAPPSATADSSPCIRNMATFGVVAAVAGAWVVM